VVIGLLLIAALSTGLIYAQAGTGAITVDACTDPNANGLCTDAVDEPAPAEVEACLDDETNCQPVPAVFDNLPAGSYTVFLRFVGASQGYYPTTGRVSIDLADDAQEEVTLGAVYPIHPKGIAVHAQLNKVYAVFQGPLVISGTQRFKPYPFVAVIDGDTDEVLYTIPGGEEGILAEASPHAPNFVGIGRGPWGVAVSGDSQRVFVGSFEDGLITSIDPFSDTTLTIHTIGNDSKPTAPSVNPVTGFVHFADYEQGLLLILSDPPFFPFIENPPVTFSPLGSSPPMPWGATT
jgi:DNA-binding beta-propeller fold protein YncE